MNKINITALSKGGKEVKKVERGSAQEEMTRDVSEVHLPLMMHFSRVLPTEPEAGFTASNSGGTTGDPNMGEDANIDYDD